MEFLFLMNLERETKFQPYFEAETSPYLEIFAKLKNPITDIVFFTA